MDIIKKITKEELAHKLAHLAGVVKLVCGVANNAALLVVLDAHDKVRQHPAYRHKVKHLYNHAIQTYRKQENEMLYNRINRMFHLADMPENIRKKYGNITDAQYFEYWQGLGAKAYNDYHHWITSLQNKFRLSLQSHDVEHYDILAWVMTAQSWLELACTMYDETLKSSDLPKKALDYVFGQFSMRRTADIWYQAMVLTEPQTEAYDLDPIEERNIAMGVQQLQDAWSDPKLIYGSAFDATIDFNDIFRTKGENKKALREIKGLLAETEEAMKK